MGSRQIHQSHKHITVTMPCCLLNLLYKQPAGGYA
jgi:hypothetical protein